MNTAWRLPRMLSLIGLLLLSHMGLAADQPPRMCDWALKEDISKPKCLDPPLHLLPDDLRASVPQLFTCETPDGPVNYHPIPEAKLSDSECGPLGHADILLFSGSSDRQLLPFLFASIQAFLQCVSLIHVVVPLHEAHAIKPFLPQVQSRMGFVR